MNPDDELRAKTFSEIKEFNFKPLDKAMMLDLLQSIFRSWGETEIQFTAKVRTRSGWGRKHENELNTGSRKATKKNAKDRKEYQISLRSFANSAWTCISGLW